MQADMYQYSNKSTNLKQNEAIFIVIHDLASRVCEKVTSRLSMWSCNFHGSEAWSTFFLLINLSVHTMMCSRNTQSDEPPRKGQAMVTVFSSSSCRRRWMCELMTTRIVSHRIGKHAHPFETIQTPGEKSSKTHLMTEKIGVILGIFWRRADWRDETFLFVSSIFALSFVRFLLIFVHSYLCLCIKIDWA